MSSGSSNMCTVISTKYLSQTIKSTIRPDFFFFLTTQLLVIPAKIYVSKNPEVGGPESLDYRQKNRLFTCVA